MNLDDDNQGVQFEEQEGAAVVNLADADDSDFGVIPRGTYNIVIDEAEYKLSDSSGNHMFSLKLSVSDGEYEGRKLFTHIVFSPKSLGMAKKQLRALGMEGEIDFAAIRMEQETADLLVGKSARAKVSIEKYDGEDTNRVKRILPAGESADDIMSAD